MKTSDFDFYLPEELIAQHPLERRDYSRLMVLDKETGEIEHKHFYDVINYLNPGDTLVLNNTRVMPARLIGEKAESGGKIEFLLLKRIEGDKWECLAYVTLHVGLGTFRPVKVDDVNEHVMHSEFYHLEEEDAKIINETKKRGNKIISVGTTSTRTLETIGDENGFVKAQSGWTNIFIYPGYKFKVVDKLITNFHLPESTLIMLVSALAGKEKVMNAYNEAVKERYRFFSFGDSMIIK